MSAPSTSGAGGEAGGGLHSTSARRAPTGGAGHGNRRPARPSGRAPGAQQVTKQRYCRCGKAHRPDRCRYANYNCNECNQRGHLKVMCRVRENIRSARQNYADLKPHRPDCTSYSLPPRAARNPGQPSES
ncbi:unnamed protein product [Diatraea saccharalis]|uniref:CCHC-type domain-containing protein n=1 Tax=Diatraea saccharalis TaxID=40085 RepID=A0A9N9WF10_9NEOP|nr:unnamed protein product [Diatraea saccharalis]